ncbi:MAG: hypothetical protein IPH18_14915 [Chitinophagaceae bacterium]|nr:hypothetical protein [Chitinophagaceae bacterium]
MKKVIAFLSSFFVVAGLKAQVTTTIKKETGKPITADSLQLINKGISINQNDKAIKFDRNIKVTDKILKLDKISKESNASHNDTVIKGLPVKIQMKESPATIKNFKY